MSSLKRTHQVYCGQIAGHFLKELSMSGSGKLWVSFEQNCQRSQGVCSKNAWWVIWQVSFEQTHNLPTDQIEIKVVGKF